jgi:predicted glycoside hydrolase/deacetylase ChbG (UPF0249 family)
MDGPLTVILSSPHRIMTRLPRSLAFALITGALGAPAVGAQSTKAPEVVLRLDDIGMNHSVNMAVEKVAATGMPFSVSVLFVAPWYQEAVDILKKNPQVTVGVHLALNSEWRGYRWGPVLGKAGVPSLVDSVGYLRPSVEDFLASKYDLAEVERELTAQMDRAVASGLKIAYVDAHMGTAESTPQLREVLERVARKYNVGISTYFNESSHEIWGVKPAAKQTEFFGRLTKLTSDRPNLEVLHVAERTPEMDAIYDQNAAEQNVPGAKVVDHRKAELETLLSPQLAQLWKSGQIRLENYGQLIARVGLSAMHAPPPERPTP